jgi:hypothetical protein
LTNQGYEYLPELNNPESLINTGLSPEKFIKTIPVLEEIKKLETKVKKRDLE